mgnify:CR=1 FL=1|jgi:hypothetical protein
MAAETAFGNAEVVANKAVFGSRVLTSRRIAAAVFRLFSGEQPIEAFVFF